MLVWNLEIMVDKCLLCIFLSILSILVLKKILVLLRWYFVGLSCRVSRIFLEMVLLLMKFCGIVLGVKMEYLNEVKKMF